MTSWLAGPGLIVMLFDGPAFRPPPENSSAMVPAVSMVRPVRVATPPETVAVAPTN